MAVQGNYAYIGEGSALTILDITNPAAPGVVGKADPLPRLVHAVAGSYAYVADGDGGLHIIDISNPALPTEAGFYDTPGWVGPPTRSQFGLLLAICLVIRYLRY